MPIYEYDCPSCGRFEVLQKMSAAPLAVHEACGSEVRRAMSASAFAFKGAGFYLTDYGGRNAAAITGRGDKAEKADKGEKKADACAGCPNKSAA